MSPSFSYPQIALTDSQELQIAHFKYIVPKLSREDLEKNLIDIIKQKFAYENAFKAEIKGKFCPSNIL